MHRPSLNAGTFKLFLVAAGAKTRHRRSYPHLQNQSRPTDLETISDWTVWTSLTRVESDGKPSPSSPCTLVPTRIPVSCLAPSPFLLPCSSATLVSCGHRAFHTSVWTSMRIHPLTLTPRPLEPRIKSSGGGGRIVARIHCLLLSTAIASSARAPPPSL